jgi:hypothetical protein
MPLFTCFQCGAQFPESETPPQSCPICEDERQFVRWSGQKWLAREELAATQRLEWRDDLGLDGIGLEPGFAIGQRALLVPEKDGLVMWDCIPLATEAAIGLSRFLSDPVDELVQRRSGRRPRSTSWTSASPGSLQRSPQDSAFTQPCSSTQYST